MTFSGDVSPVLTSRAGTGGGNTVPDILVAPINCQGGSGIDIQEGLTDTITAAANSSGNNLFAVAIAENVIGRRVHNGGNGLGAQNELAYTLDTAGVQAVAVDVIDKTETVFRDCVPCLTATCFKEQPAIRVQGFVRRLLPVECERLMGFPDNWTRISWNGKPEEKCPDAPRYKACGNSMCVNVMRWIGEQIQRVEDENRNNRPEDGNR